MEKPLSGRDVNLLSIARWLMVRDIGHMERGAAQLELQQSEMKSCNKQVVIIIPKMVYKLKWKVLSMDYVNMPRVLD